MSRTSSDYMICTETYRNGGKIAITAVILALQMTVKRELIAIRSIVFCTAVLGFTLPTAYVRLTATATHRLTGSAPSVLA